MKTVSKVDDPEIKRNVSLLFALHSYLLFLAFLSLSLLPITWSDFKTVWSCKITVHMAIFAWCKVFKQGFHKFSHNYWHSMFEMIRECLSLTLDEPTIGPHDTGQRIPCFNRCPLTITWMSNIKEREYKSSQPISWSLAAKLTRVTPSL